MLLTGCVSETPRGFNLNTCGCVQGVAKGFSASLGILAHELFQDQMFRPCNEQALNYCNGKYAVLLCIPGQFAF